MLGNWLTKSSSATFGVKPSLGTKTKLPRSAASSSSGCFGSSGSGHPNEGVEGRRVKSAFPRETRYQEWADLIRAVEIKHAPLIEQDSRKKVVRESRHFRAAVENSKSAVGKNPRIEGVVFPRVR